MAFPESSASLIPYSCQHQDTRSIIHRTISCHLFGLSLFIHAHGRSHFTAVLMHTLFLSQTSLCSSHTTDPLLHQQYTYIFLPRLQRLLYHTLSAYNSKVQSCRMLATRAATREVQFSAQNRHTAWVKTQALAVIPMMELTRLFPAPTQCSEWMRKSKGSSSQL